MTDNALSFAELRNASQWDAPMQQALFALDMHGFTVIPDVLDAAEIQDLRRINERVHPQHGDDSRHYGAAGHITNLPRRDPGYWKVLDHPAILPLLECVLGPDLIIASLNSRIIRPGDGPQRFHSDVPPALRRPGPPLMLNAIWMLDDFTIANGATLIVPGSHMHAGNPDPGPKYARDDDHDQELRRAMFPAPEVVRNVEGAAGSVIMFDGRCWHAGGHNSTDRNRHGLFANYRQGTWMRFGADPHEGFAADWHGQLNDRQKRLMRMDRGVGYPTGSDYREDPAE
jgi:hypothetical protein